MSVALLTLFGAVGAVAAMLTVLLPVILAQGKGLRREIDAQGAELRRQIDDVRREIDAQGTELRRQIDTQGAEVRREIDSLRGEVGSLRSDMAETRRDLHALSDRIARIEGALTGPWRPDQRLPGSGSESRRSRPADEHVTRLVRTHAEDRALIERAALAVVRRVTPRYLSASAPFGCARRIVRSSNRRMMAL